MLKWVLGFLILFHLGTGYSQSKTNIQRCAQQQVSDAIRDENSEIIDIVEQNEIAIENWILRQQKKTTIQGVITIPIVFHILYNTPEQNLPEQQILDQLEALNRDYRKNNPDTIITPKRFQQFASDTEIEFCLATQNPDGQFTNGIIRKKVDQPKIGTTKNYYQPTKGGSQIWDPRYYLNIWVCEINDSLLGFTYLPGEALPNFDGIVLNYKICGNGEPAKPPFNKGRTLVHEIGHWLNLQHPWGAKESCDYDDGVSDTPLQEKPNGGCPNAINISCNNAPNGDMYVNYMDYTYDNCQNIFTHGQKKRMLATLNTSRKTLLNSVGCLMPDTTKPFVEVIDLFPNPARDLLTIRFNLSSSQNAKIYIYDLTGKTVYVSEIRVEKERVQIDISAFQNGSYILNVTTHSINQNHKFVKLE